MLDFTLCDIHITTLFCDSENTLKLDIKNNSENDLIFNSDFAIKLAFPLGESVAELCTAENAKSIIITPSSDDWKIANPRVPKIEGASVYWNLSPKYDETVLKKGESIVINFTSVACNAKEGETKINCSYNILKSEEKTSIDILFHKYHEAIIEAKCPENNKFNEVEQVEISWNMLNAKEGSATLNGEVLKSLNGKEKKYYEDWFKASEKDKVANVKLAVKNKAGRETIKVLSFSPCAAKVLFFYIEYIKAPKQMPVYVMCWKTNTLTTLINNQKVGFAGNRDDSNFLSIIEAVDLKGNKDSQIVVRNDKQNWELHKRFCISMCTPDEEAMLWKE